MHCVSTELQTKLEEDKKKERLGVTCKMGSAKTELYFVFMNYDPEYERIRSHRTKRGTNDELDVYLSKKHDDLLSRTLQQGTYKKTLSLVIVDGFAVEITDDQANVLRSANGVRVVEKNEEVA